MRVFRAPDGLAWSVEARSPSSSSIMIVFHYPDPDTARRNRYTWVNWHGAESRSVTARIKPADAIAALSDEDLARLWRRSMLIAGAPMTLASTPGLG